MQDLLTSIFQSDTNITELSVIGLLIALGTAFVLGLLVSVVYLKSNKGRILSQSFALTLVLLPAVVTIIIMLVGNNVARAFSLSGAFAIIRFRSAPGNPKDITFVLFNMAIGLACGMGFILYAAIAAVLLCAVMIVLELAGFGKSKTTAHLLKITIPEDLDYRNVFDGILGQYTKGYHLVKVKTADLGSVFELSYKINMTDTVNEKEFIDALRCRNGNLNISLVLDAGGDDYQEVQRI